MALDRNGGGVTRRTFVKGGLAASALAALAACGKNENAASAQGDSAVKATDGGTFKYYISDPVAIDPYNLQESEGTQVGHVLFDSLVEWDWDKSDVKAKAAASWEISDDNTVFTLLGDGECQEGQVWEAAMFAAHRNLDNLVAIIDRNGLQIDGKTSDVCDPGDLASKFTAFGWEAHEIDGHDVAALRDAFAKVKSARDSKPHVFIARTIKGKGVSFMEDQAGWHGKAPNAEELEQALIDLGAAKKEA